MEGYEMRFTRRGVMKTGAATVAATAIAPRLLANEPSMGGTLRLGLTGANSSDSFDSRTHSDTYMQVAGMGCVFDALIEVNARGEVVGELAEDWTVSDDAKTFTLKLRKDVTFHNGKPFVADDVVESLEIHLGEDSGSAAKPIVENVDRVTKVNDHELIIELKVGDADFLYLLSDYHIMMFPSGMVKQAMAEGIGTGLYRVANFDPGVRLLVERVEGHYKDGKAGWFDGCEIIAINEAVARMNALQTNQVDAVSRVDFKTEQLLTMNPAIEIFEVTGNTHYTFAMLTNVSPYDQLNVRKALKHAINRQEMVDKILLGHGSVSYDNPIGPANPYFHENLTPIEYDPDKAKHYLKQAGMDSLDVNLSAAEAAFPGATDAAQLYSASAEACNININVVKESDDGYWSNVWLKKPWSAVYWSGRATENWMFEVNYKLGAPWNDTHWDNQEFQTLMAQGRGETNPDTRRTIYHRMQELVSQEGGTVIPMYANFVDANSTGITHGPDLGNAWPMDGARICERWWTA